MLIATIYMYYGSRASIVITSEWIVLVASEPWAPAIFFPTVNDNYKNTKNWKKGLLTPGDICT